MIDWKASMGQTFEFYMVDPDSWMDKRLLTTVTACTISRDSSAETLGSATIDSTETFGEQYVRAYLIVTQNDETEKVPLGTFLVQTPSSEFDGMVENISMDAYTPLLELKEKLPPLGFTVKKNSNVMYSAGIIIPDRMRAKVIGVKDDQTLSYNFIANANDTWLTFLTDLIAQAQYKFDLDALGRVSFKKKRNVDVMSPIWTYDDGNSSILYPSIKLEHDIYGIPNVVEVIYSNGSEHIEARAVNDDPKSKTSTISRGREIVHRETDPDFAGIPTIAQVEAYAKNLLAQLSTVEYSVTYTHAYCPVTVGDCVLLDYKNAGLENIKAVVISQSIKCVSGCPVTEKAVFTANLLDRKAIKDVSVYGTV